MLDEERRARILELLGATQGAKLESLLEGEEETAGSLMNTEFLALDEELTVAHAIEAIRQYPRKESFFYVYCVDADHHLVGVLSLRSLILADASARLKDIMVQSVVRTQVDSSPEEVAQLVSKYDLLSMPVVDHAEPARRRRHGRRRAGRDPGTGRGRPAAPRRRRRQRARDYAGARDRGGRASPGWRSIW